MGTGEFLGPPDKMQWGGGERITCDGLVFRPGGSILSVSQATETGIEPRPVTFKPPKCLNLILFIFFQPRIPPPDYKLPPEKLGYLRHVTPGPKQVMPDNFHVENIHLRHAYRPSPSQSELPRYSHLLRKTGRRGELGIEDDDDSDVTRISFDVPLIRVT